MLGIKLIFDVKDKDQLDNLPNILSFCFVFYVSWNIAGFYIATTNIKAWT